MRIAMLYLVFTTFFIGFAWAGCPMRPLSEHSSARRILGDGGYRILISGEHDKYIPDAVYSISLQGSRTHERLQQFTRFTLSVDSQHAPNKPSTRVGFFQLFPDALTQFNEDCVNTISEATDYPKSEIQVMWRAPPTGSGCVVFTAMVLEDAHRWYAEDGKLSRSFCEISPEEIEHLNDDRCCACDNAKYLMVMEGLWTNITHPKDFPFSVWLTHFSDVVGASHETNFSFWGHDHIATDGFRQLAEWGSASGLEGELKLKAKHLRTFIKAAGLWYPHVNSNTTANFRVDRKHPMLSVASMLGPSPDWVVGVSKLNLCQKDCTWVKSMIIDLYPWDAGTDNGITYMSPNSETKPREKMKPITTSYPEDPRSPFYDPSGRPMLPLARLYLTRDKIYPKSCNDQTFEEQVLEFQVTENTEDTERPECLTTEYSPWSPCSVSCGKGIRMRTRDYRMPEKAAMMGCNRQLISKEMCVSSAPECPDSEDNDDRPFLDDNAVCSTTEWSDWSECSSQCGEGLKMRTRRLVNHANRKKCHYVPLVEKIACIEPPCTTRTEFEDPTCKVTLWSDWSPCSVTCGQGVKTRTRYLMTNPDDPAVRHCSGKVELVQHKSCLDKADCTFDVATAKVVCMEEPEVGPCRGYYQRWAFDAQKQMCVTFTYGGCRGNKNNFHSEEECKQICNVVLNNRQAHQTQTSNQPLQPEIEVKSTLPEDCVVSRWSPWTPCNVTCGSGRVYSFRTIERHPRNGGKVCPKKLQRRARCQLAPCE